MFTEPEGYNCFNMIIALVLSNSAINCRNKEASRIFCFNCVDCPY